ncbi:hydroxysqualene dehydroxylase HpnE [Acidicapsa ligni]|uniref:hydroxysqualene dehydroxylase HpnE n=1 Tax=Acidicapsa ligni TaxID=542300 RepID=UPI0021E09B38|nr:hydroxysqualene dehydroxylase HpnE [Acidicapsa ligni]
MTAASISSTPGIRKTQHVVTIVGGGVAGLTAACALADAGFRVQVLERRSYPGGRASSYLHPGTGEVIDNCQHVLFGCCTNLIDLYQRIGVADKIFWDSKMTLIEPGGRRSVLAPSSLPAPMHGLPGILKSNCFSLADKFSIIFALVSVMLKKKQDPDEDLASWLKSHRQTRGAMNRFWWLVIASALNADLDQIAMPYAAKVIRELFLNSANAGSMGMSTVPLSDLYRGAEDYLKARHSEIIYNANVDAAEWDEEAQLWTVTAAGKPYVSESLILALPFEATAKLLPKMPANEDAIQLAEELKKLEHWPICSVHLWFDREITELPHAVLLDRDIHWMYHKSRWQPQRNSNASYIELVVSVSREFAALSREQALARAIEQLAEFFPEVKKAKIVKSALIKEVRATFGVPPGIDAVRPSAVSPWPNCFLAGDWIATGWPSTMESAARSGYLAAEALCNNLGDDRQLLVADLKPTGLMRFFC